MGRNDGQSRDSVFNGRLIDEFLVSNAFQSMMNDSPPSPERSRTTRVIIVLAAPFAIAAIMFITAVPIYNHLAKKDFEAHIKDLEASGESLQIAGNVPAAVLNPEENFAEADFVHRIVSTARNLQLLETPNSPSKFSAKAIPGYESPGNHRTVRFLSVPSIHLSFPELTTDKEAAKVIADYAKGIERDLNAFENATRRQRSNLSIDYSEGFSMALPEANVFHNIAKLIQLRARSSIYFDESDQAFNDVNTLLRLSRHISAESSLIFQLIANSIYGMAISTVREGIQNQTWSPAQLRALEQAIDFQTLSRGFISSLRMERALFAETMVQLAQGRYPSDEDLISLIPDVEIPVVLIPNGLFYENARMHSAIFQKSFFMPGKIGGRTVEFPFGRDLAKEIDARISSRTDKIRYVFAMISLPVYEGILTRFQRVQVLTDHAKLAILLEIHAQENGSYPEKLENLTTRQGERNTTDPFTGQPYIYELISPSEFQIYSVGPDKVDEKGLIKHAYEQGDWVWLPYLPEDFDFDSYRNR